MHVDVKRNIKISILVFCWTLFAFWIFRSVAIAGPTTPPPFTGVPCIQGGACYLTNLTVKNPIASGGTPAATTTALNLFVDGTNGTDNSTCGNSSGAGACATIPFVYTKVPKLIRHSVTVSIACGTYTAGAYVEGDTFQYVPSLNSGSFNPGNAGTPQLAFNGTLQNDALASGLVTGTFVSTTQGTETTDATFSVTAAGWTAGDLVGRFVQVTSGVDNGEIRPIKANTNANPGVATIVGLWSTQPANGDSFAIVKSCSIVQDGLTVEQLTIPITTTVNKVFTTAFAIEEPISSGPYAPQVILQNIQISVLQGGDGIKVLGNGTNSLLQGLKFLNAGGVASTQSNVGLISIRNWGQAKVYGNVFAPTLNTFGVTTNNTVPTNPVTINAQANIGNAVDARNNLWLGASLAGNIAPFELHGGRNLLIQNTINTGSGLFGAINCIGCNLVSVGDKISVAAGAGSAIATNIFTNSTGLATIALFGTIGAGGGNGTSFINCHFGVQPTIVIFEDNVSSATGFGIAYNMDSYNCQINGAGTGSIPNPAGSTQEDIHIGFPSQNYTWAQLNGFVPKTIADTGQNNIIMNGP